MISASDCRISFASSGHVRSTTSSSLLEYKNSLVSSFWTRENEKGLPNNAPQARIN